MYVNVSDNATFNIHVQASETGPFDTIYVRYRSQGYIIFRFIFECYLDFNLCVRRAFHFFDRNRASVRVENVSAGMQDINVSISDIKPFHSGTFMFQLGSSSGNGTCFKLYVLGKYYVPIRLF